MGRQEVAVSRRSSSTVIIIIIGRIVVVIVIVIVGVVVVDGVVVGVVVVVVIDGIGIVMLRGRFEQTSEESTCGIRVYFNGGQARETGEESYGRNS